MVKPRLARIVRVDLDSQGTDRYYDCQYRVRGGGSFKVVRRAAQSLCLLLIANDIQENADVTQDSISFPTEIPNQGRKPRPRVKVHIGNVVCCHPQVPASRVMSRFLLSIKKMALRLYWTIPIVQNFKAFLFSTVFTPCKFLSQLSN